MEKDDASSIDSATESESIGDILSSFKKQLKDIDLASRTVNSQMTSLFSRAKHETIDWMNEPLTPTEPVKAWCLKNGLSATPTLNEFFNAVFSAAVTMDYETRAITFKKQDAAVLCNGAYTLTVFDLIAAIPKLFL